MRCRAFSMSIFSSVLGATGGLFGGALSAFGSSQANKSNYDLGMLQLQEAINNRKWQEYMSSTAYQRQRADLEKAGYNPLLALNSGGASTPVGSTPNLSVASQSNNLSSFSNPVSSAFEAVSNIQSLKLQQAELLRAQANIEKAQADTANIIADTQAINQEIDINAKRNHLESRHIEAQTIPLDIGVSGNGISPDDDSFLNLMEMYKNRIKTDKYLSDPERVKSLEVIHEIENAIDTGSSAFFKAKLASPRRSSVRKKK